MRYGRVRRQGRLLWVIDEGGRLVEMDEPHLDRPSLRPSPRVVPPDGLAWEPPVQPSKIVAVGRNYALHAKEHGAEVPKEPLLFLKAPSSLLPAGEVVLPPESSRVEFEGELAVVVGRTLRRWVGDDAREVVAAWLVADDVTARDLQASDGQWARAKSFDTFCPVARLASTEPPPGDAVLQTRVNGELRQAAPLADMTFPVARVLAHASAAMTLLPGDLVLTGTPAGVGPLRPGDRVVVSVTGLPDLEHGVRAEG